MDTPTELPCWALIHLSGLPFPLAGYVEEATVGGARFLRLNIPAPVHGFRGDRLYNTSTVRAITPCSQEHARRTATRQWQSTSQVAG